MLHNRTTHWTDLDDHSRFRNAAPNVIIRADAIANGEYDGLAGDEFHPGISRNAVYVDETVSPAVRYPVELALYIHPTGAGQITLYSSSTSQVRGRLLLKTGAFAGANADNQDIAGGMLTHYCDTTSLIGSSSQTEPVWATTLEEGDAIWLVRRGRWEAKCDAGLVTADNNVCTDNTTTTGTIADSVATIATLAEILENVGGVAGKCIGRSLEAESGGYADIQLELPPLVVR